MPHPVGVASTWGGEWNVTPRAELVLWARAPHVAGLAYETRAGCKLSTTLHNDIHDPIQPVQHTTSSVLTSGTWSNFTILFCLTFGLSCCMKDTRGV